MTQKEKNVNKIGERGTTREEHDWKTKRVGEWNKKTGQLMRMGKGRKGGKQKVDRRVAVRREAELNEEKGSDTQERQL